MLPKEKSKKQTKMEGLSWLIYGQAGIGKSTFASQFPSVLVFDTQEGYNCLEVFKVNISNWQDFLNVMAEMAESEKNEYQNICIDTIDDLYKMCFDYVCKKHNMEHPSDEGFGKGWGLINDEFKRVILKLMKYHPIFISHAEDKEVKTNVMTLTKTQPTIAGKSGILIAGIVDIIGYIYSNKGERFVKFMGDSSSLIAKDRTGILPESMPFSYEAIKEAFEVKKTKKEGK